MARYTDTTTDPQMTAIMASILVKGAACVKCSWGVSTLRDQHSIDRALYQATICCIFNSFSSLPATEPASLGHYITIIVYFQSRDLYASENIGVLTLPCGLMSPGGKIY